MAMSGKGQLCAIKTLFKRRNYRLLQNNLVYLTTYEIGRCSFHLSNHARYQTLFDRAD